MPIATPAIAQVTNQRLMHQRLTHQTLTHRTPNAIHIRHTHVQPRPEWSRSISAGRKRGAASTPPLPEFPPHPVILNTPLHRSSLHLERTAEQHTRLLNRSHHIASSASTGAWQHPTGSTRQQPAPAHASREGAGRKDTQMETLQRQNKPVAGAPSCAPSQWCHSAASQCKTVQ